MKRLVSLMLCLSLIFTCNCTVLASNEDIGGGATSFIIEYRPVNYGTYTLHRSDIYMTPYYATRFADELMQDSDAETWGKTLMGFIPYAGYLYSVMFTYDNIVKSDLRNKIKAKADYAFATGAERLYIRYDVAKGRSKNSISLDIEVQKKAQLKDFRNSKYKIYGFTLPGID